MTAMDGAPSAEAGAGRAGLEADQTRILDCRLPVLDRLPIDGIAPSNFGSALGYAAFHVSASATSHALVADSQTTATP